MKKISIILLLIILQGSLIQADAQAPTVKSVLTLGGGQNDIGRFVKYTSDGGYLAVGTTNSDTGDVEGFHETYAGTGRYDSWIWKVNANGTIKWKKCLFTFYEDNPVEAFENSDSSFDIFLLNYLTMIMVKLDKNGNLIKYKSYFKGFYVYNQSTLTKTPFAVTRNKDGGYAVVMEYGNLDSSAIQGFHGKGTSTSDILFFTLDDTGKIIHKKCIGGTGLDAPYDIIEKKSGGYFLLGSTTSYDGDATGRIKYSKNLFKSTYLTDVWILSLQKNGDTIWQRNLGGENADYGYSLLESDNGTLVFCGKTGSDSGVVKGHTKNDNLVDIPDAWVCKYDTLSKNLIWQYTSSIKGDDFAMKIKQDGLGYLLCIGSGYNTTDLVYKTTLISFKPDGALNYTYQPPVNKSNYGLGMDIDKDNSIILCGYTDDRNVNSFFKSRHIAEMFVIQFNGYKSSVNSTKKDSEILIYPVPASSSLYLKVPETFINHFLTIYDITGRVMEQKLITELNSHVNILGYAKGIYTARISTENIKFIID